MGEARRVCARDDLASGTARCFAVDGHKIALVRIDDDFYATAGRCAHLQGPLGEGRVDDHVLSCPWHGWQYDVRTGLNEFDHAIHVQTYAVRVEDGDVKVALP